MSTARATLAAASSHRRWRLLLTALCIGAWAIQLPAVLRAQTPFSPDSASYIECARSIRSGKGFLVRQERGLDPVIWKPIKLWPPGFPLLIALTQALTGLDALTAGVVVSLFCVGLFLAVFIWISLELLPGAIAFPAAFFIAVMHPTLMISAMCWSEGAYLFASVASIACLMAWMKPIKRPSFWLFSAGVWAGAAYGIRNVAVALIAATVLFLVCDGRRSFNVLARNLLIWAGGVVLAAGLVVLRSLMVFGSLNPYAMPASELTLQQNIQRAAWVILRDLTTWHTAATILSRGLMPLFYLALLAAVLLFCLIRSYGRKQNKGPDFQRRVFLFMGCYAAIYSAVLIFSRTRYYWWGEPINSRHLVQIYWILVVLSAYAAVRIARRLLAEEKIARQIILVLLLLGIGLQARFHYVQLRDASDDTFHQPLNRSATERLAAIVPKDRIVLACRAYQLRIFSDLAARQLPRVYRGEKPLSLEEIQQAGRAKTLWGIVIDDPRGVELGKYGQSIQKIMHAQRWGAGPWQRVSSNSQLIVLQYAQPENDLP